MQHRVFSAPVGDPSGCDELNRFLAGHRVLSVQREFVQHGSGSFWSFCVEYLDGGGGASGSGPRKDRIDYKLVLPPAQFAVFARLRDCRKELATKEGVPAFAVCTDGQLAAMAQADELTPAALGTVDGFGEAKTAKYGAALMAAHANREEPA